MSTLTADRKQEIIAKFGDNAEDTGSTRVQVALLTARMAWDAQTGATISLVLCLSFMRTSCTLASPLS